MPQKKKEEVSLTAVSKSPAKRKAKATSGAKSPRAASSAVKKSPKKTLPKKPAIRRTPKEIVSVPARVSRAPGAPKLASLSSHKPSRIIRQGQTQMVTFIRDPHCLFTYWEISTESLEAMKRELQQGFAASFRVLKLFKIGPQGEEILVQEISVRPDEMNRYISLDETGGAYFLEVGQKSASGRYLPYARSNKVTTAVGAFSSVTDPNWEPTAGMLEYFSEEGLEDSREFNETVVSSAASGARRKGRHSASLF